MKPQRLPDDKDLVVPGQVTVWAGPSREVTLPMYVVDEASARYYHATHLRCEKHGTIYEKYRQCPECHAEHLDEVWAKMEAVKMFDLNDPAFLFDGDVIFHDSDDIDLYCDEHGIIPQELRVVEGVPHICPPLEPMDILDDYLPDDSDSNSIPKPVLDAFDALNKAIADAGPLCWVPGKRKVIL